MESRGDIFLCVFVPACPWMPLVHFQAICRSHSCRHKGGLRSSDPVEISSRSVDRQPCAWTMWHCKAGKCPRLEINCVVVFVWIIHSFSVVSLAKGDGRVKSDVVILFWHYWLCCILLDVVFVCLFVLCRSLSWWDSQALARRPGSPNRLRRTLASTTSWEPTPSWRRWW